MIDLHPCLAVFRDVKSGKMVLGTSKVAEFSSAGSAIHYLERDGWYMSGTDQAIYFKRDGVILHECRLIY